MIKILLCANNWGGLQVAEWLRQHQADQEIVGLVVHPAWDGKFRQAILDTIRLPSERIINANALRDPATIRHIASLEPDIGLSAFFGYILKPQVFKIPPRGFVNLHTGYLPYNRGWHPNVYPLLDGTLAGVALHYIDGGIDSGPVIAKRLVETHITDTGGLLHQRLTRELVDLFKKTWMEIVHEAAGSTPQCPDIGTFHYRREMHKIECIEFYGTYVAEDLINIIRGNTYPPYPGAYFEYEGERIYMRMELLREADLDPKALPDWSEGDECDPCF